MALERTGEVGEAERLHREALSRRRRTFGEEHGDVAMSLHALANVLQRKGKLDEAERLHREALALWGRLRGEEDPNLATGLHNLANVLKDQGRLEEAERTYRKALAMQRKLFGEEHLDVAKSLHGLGHVFESRGDLKEAESFMRQALRIQGKAADSEPQRLAESYHCLGVVLMMSKNMVEAEGLLRQAVEIRKRLSGGHALALRSMNTLAAVLTATQQHAAAQTVYSELLEDARKRFPPGDPEVATALLQLCNCLLEQSRFGDAEPLAREALAIRAEKLPASWLHYSAMSTLGGSLLGLGRLTEAEPFLLEAASRMEPPTASAVRRRQALERLVRLYEAMGKEAEAKAWREKL